jgi:hypothetical protein
LAGAGGHSSRSFYVVHGIFCVETSTREVGAFQGACGQQCAALGTAKHGSGCY